MKIKYIGNLNQPEQSLIEKNLNEFIKLFDPIEGEEILIFVDNCTGAPYFESHIQAEKLLSNSTIDVPLDPDNQGEYRANRDIVDDHSAFLQMQDDAVKKRSFSNIVVEYSMEYDNKHPLKIIGGQHRYLAIKEAYDDKIINEYHGIKTYFCLNKTQRLDVQLISNTNIAISGDLLDRMNETVKGPELRNWCQEVGLLGEKQDFADKKERGGNITVRGARSFILSYFEGTKYDTTNFHKIKPETIFVKTGGLDEQWEGFRRDNNFWEDAGLKEAGKELAKLNTAQHNAIAKSTSTSEFAEKALSYPIITSWAYVAGLLCKNKPRLQRHYSLKENTSPDPLNTSALSRGKHKTDPDNYRGLGARTDIKDRGRLVELFFLQAERGSGITPAMVDAAIKRYHVKLAQLEYEEAQKKI